MNETPNQKRGIKLLMWATLMLACAACMVSVWHVWSLIMAAGLFALALLFATWGFTVQDRDLEND